MQTVAASPQTRKPVAFYAHLGDTYGVALRASDNTVHFQTDATGQWQPLTDADRSRLHLHGEIAVADAQALRDGNVVRKTSRTLQQAA